MKVTQLFLRLLLYRYSTLIVMLLEVIRGFKTQFLLLRGLILTKVDLVKRQIEEGYSSIGSYRISSKVLVLKSVATTRNSGKEEVVVSSSILLFFEVLAEEIITSYYPLVNQSLEQIEQIEQIVDIQLSYRFQRLRARLKLIELDIALLPSILFIIQKKGEKNLRVSSQIYQYVRQSRSISAQFPIIASIAFYRRVVTSLRASQSLNTT